jgi:hypothetical protein
MLVVGVACTGQSSGRISWDNLMFDGNSTGNFVL